MNILSKRFGWYVLGCVVLAAFAVHAQDRGAVWYQYQPEVDLDRDGPTGTLSTSRIEARMGHPAYVGKTVRVIPAVSVSWQHFDFQNFELESLDTYGVGVPVTTVYNGFEDLTIISVLSPGMYTDFKSITGDDLRLFGMLLGARQFSETFSVNLGVIYNQDFGDPRFIPAAGFSWQVTDSLEIDANMPRPRVVYRPSPELMLDIHAMPAGDKWSIRENGQDLELVVETIRVGIGLERQVAEGLWLGLDVGANVDRSYEVEEDGGSTLIDSGADDALYARLGLIYR